MHKRVPRNKKPSWVTYEAVGLEPVSWQDFQMGPKYVSIEYILLKESKEIIAYSKVIALWQKACVARFITLD